MRLPHTVCPKCGHYRNREVIDMEEAEKKKK
jgi:ribosomal protein L32